MRSAITLIACAANLALVTFSIAGGERRLERCKVVWLEHASVDQRSLNQGDYLQDWTTARVRYIRGA